MALPTSRPSLTQPVQSSAQPWWQRGWRNAQSPVQHAVKKHNQSLRSMLP